MTAPSFSYSGNVYTSAAAGSVDFALTSTTGNPIAYLEKAHIHVYKSTNQGSTWTELTRPSQWDFVSGGTVARLVTGIATGDWIKVQRITPSTAAYVTFQSSSLLTADQLNDDTLFNTYLNQERYDQGDQSSAVAAAASASAASATSAATAATATANAASTAAAAATTTANAASASAATALSQSNTAITDSAAALAASANAVTTANTAASNAASAVTTAGTANTNATAAVNTANTAASNASTALSQSTTALSNSATALSTANTANTNASTALTNSSNAVTTANTASTNASNAVTTANTANTNATAALNAVASSLQYVLVANVAAIPSSPANNYAIEVADSTGVESFSPLANRPAGFVGDAGLSVRMQYSTTGPTWNWLNYFPNNAETRYLKLAGGTLTGQLRADDSTSVAAPVIAFDGDTNTGLAHTGADELALVTGGTARLTVDPSGAVAVTNALSVGGQAAVVTNDARLSDTRTPTDGSVTNAKVSASAAIAGSKISPDFGSQNVTTTGTATAASLIPTSSTAPTNGVYLPAANSVAISTNSTQRLLIDASGNVNIDNNTLYVDAVNNRLGISNATPRAALDVCPGGGDRGLQVTSVQSDAVQLTGTQGTASSNLRDMRIVSQTIAFGTGSSSGTTFTEKVRIDESGRLGIGTSAPGQALSVATASGNCAIEATRATRATGQVAMILRGGTSGTDWTLYQDANSDNLQVYGNNANRLVISSAGNVGIGSTSPQVPLDVSATGNAGAATDASLRAYAANRTAYLSIGYDGLNASTNSGGLKFFFNDTERARIDSSGRLLVGTSSAASNYQIKGGAGWSNTTGVTPNFQIAGTGGNFNTGVAVNKYSADGYGAVLSLGLSLSNSLGTNTLVTNNNLVGVISFNGNDGTNFIPAAQISCETDGTTGTNDMPGRLVFSVTRDGQASPTEAMRINNERDVFIGTTTTNPGVGNTTAGVMIRGNGSEFSGNYIVTSRAGGTSLFACRNTNDGDIVSFYQDGTLEGTISVSGTTVSYNGAHLSRWSQLPSGVERIEILRGTVLSNIAEMCEWTNEENEQLNRMKVSDVEGDKNVSGVFQAWDDDDDTYTDDFYCAMTGDFIIRIGAGITVERGDLLMSAGDGTAKPQDDDIIRSKTIAKVTSTNVSCTYEDGSYCVPCVLMAC